MNQTLLIRVCPPPHTLLPSLIVRLLPLHPRADEVLRPAQLLLQPPREAPGPVRGEAALRGRGGRAKQGEDHAQAGVHELRKLRVLEDRLPYQ